MTPLLEQFLNWVAAETLLSGLLFISYHIWIRRLSNPLDRFNFLSLSFGALLVLPWVPTPVLSEPLIKNLITEATLALQGTTALGNSDWIRSLLFTTLPATIPLAYFFLLSIRMVRIFSSFRKINQMIEFGTPVKTYSLYPVILHQLSVPPMTIGLWNPKILISKRHYNVLSDSEINMVIQHEEEHIRRLDGLSNLFRIFVREVLFFSPFIWNLSKKFEEEMELSVDREVLAQDGTSARTYGNLLLNIAASSHREENRFSVGAYLSNSSIKRRILSLKQRNSPRSKVLSSLALGLFVTLGTVGVSVFGTQAYSASNKVEFYIMDTNAENTEVPHGKPVLIDSDFSSAVVQSDCPDANKTCSISLRLLPESQKRFSALSTRNIGKKIGIVVNGKMVSSSVLKNSIAGPDFQITTNFSRDEAQSLVKNIGSKIKK